ncbi:MAG: TfoX/Sxy family protein [Clostridia bacterium]
MASSLEFVNFICEQIDSCGMVSCKKMFGEYMIYVNAKPIILVCDDTAFVKINEVTNNIIANNEIGEPYKGAKPHYILDVDDKELLCEVVAELEKIKPLPKPKKKKL